jgi:phenylpyruvate tautomerase PptA (4-oxalocrotonate tautomerase family)
MIPQTVGARTGALILSWPLSPDGDCVFTNHAGGEKTMPYFSIETNQTTDQFADPELLKKTSAFIADLLGKPESYVMISIHPGVPLIFGGSDDSAAFVRLKSIGLPEDCCPELSEKICGFIERELDVPKDRVFIDFKDITRSMFGWNGKTF